MGAEQHLVVVPHTGAEQHLVVVPHTHWDREWYLTHEQFRYRLVHLVDGLLDLLEGDPSFRHFTLDGQSIAVEDYLEVRPKARERVVKLVESGRLLVGPWYVLPDEWLVSGEALIRNLRTGLRVADGVGGAMRLGYVPDQFGHVGQLPQIFRAFGFEAAVLWRGVGADVRETLFEWEAPDGTRLLSVYLARGYGNAAFLPSDPVLLAERLQEEMTPLARRSRIPSLLMMNGTDHAEPNPDLPVALEAAVKRLPGVTFEIGTLPGFVERARAEAPLDLPVHAGEFRSGLRAPLLPGCASARMPQKQADFRNDRLLTRYLEPLASWLGELGGEPDTELIDFIWRIVLQNHPHDSICGCSIDAVHDQMDTRFARVAELAGAHLERVFGQIGRRVAIPTGAFDADVGPCFAVWNPNAPGRSPVEVRVEVDGDTNGPVGPVGPVGFHVRDVGGRRLACEARVIAPAREVLSLRIPKSFARSFLARESPDLLGYWIQTASLSEAEGRLALQLQLGSHESSLEDLREMRAELIAALEASEAEMIDLVARSRSQLRLRFVDDLPGHGLRVYRVVAGRLRRSPDLARKKQGDGSVAIENRHWRIDVGTDGRVSLEHRADGRRIEDAVRILSEGDRGDEYNFDPVPDGEVVSRPEGVRVSSEISPASVTVRIRGRYRVPGSIAADRASRSRRKVSLSFDLRIQLWSDLDRVDFALELENRARDHRLRVFLRAPFEAERFEVESAFEVVERPIAPERGEAGDRTPAEHPIGATPQRSFATIADAHTALTLANRGLAEVEAVPEPNATTCLALTVFRAVGWLSRSDLVKRPGHAGPPLETPKAQVPGAHKAEFSLRLHEPDAPARVAEAHRFAYPPLAAPIVGTALDPLLEDGARLVAIDDPEVVVSAVEPRKNGASLVRLYNATSRERRVSLAWRSARRLSRVDLAETPDRTSGFEDSGSSATLQLAPWQLASISVTPA